MGIWRIGAAVILTAALVPQFACASAVESKRMEHAKDLIADEQWVRAIDELKAAVADPKEPNKDEALFWLAHSQNQARDGSAAIETDPPARTRISGEPLGEASAIAAHRDRATAAAQRCLVVHGGPAASASAPTPAVPPPARADPGSATRCGAANAAPPVPHGRRRRVRQPPAFLPTAPAAAAAAGPMGSGRFFPDMDLRIQALASLMRTDAPKVIPMLRDDRARGRQRREARRALFVLAQSGRPEARSTVVEVAKTGPEPVRLAAVRELGRIGGPAVANELLQVYSTANEQVKYQVVTSLGAARCGAGAAADRAIGNRSAAARRRDCHARRGGRPQQLRRCTQRQPQTRSAPIMIGLFNAQAEDELIRIAERENGAPIRDEALARLRLLGTPKAKAYLATSTGNPKSLTNPEASER